LQRRGGTLVLAALLPWSAAAWAVAAAQAASATQPASATQAAPTTPLTQPASATQSAPLAQAIPLGQAAQVGAATPAGAAAPGRAARPAGARTAAAAGRTAGVDPPASAPIDGLTDSELNGLLSVAASKGSDLAIPPPVSSALRLSERQHRPTVRQVTFQEPNGVKHGFAALNDHSGYLLFSRDPGGHVTVYRTGANLRLVRAAGNFTSERFIELPAKQAARGLQDELRHWSAVMTPPPSSAAVSGPAGASAAGPAPASPPGRAPATDR